ncbi:MAG: hypothetical protein RJA70_3560 [Pseudomonadota bacterium]|jgi:hypothetical protein
MTAVMPSQLTPRLLTGEGRIRVGVFEARRTIKGRNKRSIALPHCQNQGAPEARATVLAALARPLRKAWLVEPTRPRSDSRVRRRRPTNRVLESTLEAAGILIAPASGKSESWISDRTGHHSSQMSARYKPVAQKAKELDLGAPINMLDAIRSWPPRGLSGELPRIAPWDWLKK